MTSLMNDKKTAAPSPDLENTQKQVSQDHMMLNNNEDDQYMDSDFSVI